MRSVYMRVTKDIYELPEAIADSPKELAELLGVSSNSVSTAIYKNKNCDKYKSERRYVKVMIDEEDE